MKTLNYFLLLFLITGITIISCKKDEISEQSESILAMQMDYPPIVSGNGILDEETTLAPTILGNVRTNPYSVEVMKEAWNNLNPTVQISNLPPSHLYVKFSPSNENDYLLLEKTNEMFYDYPLEYELITLGDYYPQDGKAFPEMWAIVPPNFQSPITGYTIINELFISRYNTQLTQEAFNLTGNIYDIGNDEMFIPSDKNNIQSYKDPKANGGGDGGSGGSGGDGGSGGTTSDPTLKTNACGCLVYPDSRKPGGCLKVNDVEKSIFEGVRRVKIIMKDTWFTEDETWTDDLGCWKIDNRYYGNAWMWVKFVSDRCKIRGARAGANAIYDWIWPVKDYVGRVRNGPPFNNIEVKYDMWVNKGSAAHIHWGAATVNNALHEFYDYSPGEGINNPPWIDIYVGRNNAYGYAIMNTYLGNSNVIRNLASGGIFGLPFLGAPKFGGLLFPDVYIGIDFKNSDRLKRLASHEYAHASHFTKAGPFFWETLISAEAGANGHGNSGSTNAGIIAIAESWAEHVALTYTHNTYGAKNTAYWLGSWAATREKVRNEETSHIPIGLYNDFIDGLSEEWACDYSSGGCGTVLDWIQGYSNSQMFKLLSANTTSPVIFKDRFIQSYANGNLNLINQINTLFAAYQ